MLTKFQLAAIEVLLFIALGGGLYAWGDIHRGKIDAQQSAAKLVEAQNEQRLRDEKLTAQINVISAQAIDNQTEADRENNYAITLENEIKARPNPVACKPTAARLRWLRGAGKD